MAEVLVGVTRRKTCLSVTRVVIHTTRKNVASNDPCPTLSEIELVASHIRIYVSTAEDLRNPTTLHTFALGEV